MRLVGETVTVVEERGGGFDDDGHKLPSETVRTDFPGSVVGHRSTSIDARTDAVLTSTDVSVWLRGVQHLEPNTSIEARGVGWRLDGEEFHHVSAFGSSLAWTEIPVRRVSA
ncbi:hypothetical protein ACTXO6_13430 [Corynebacterium variabile]|uniref:hypothetical protein n=1 Tax=Corynebacterium variabile TaxID=1727 RepID=UPI003FD3FF95